MLQAFKNGQGSIILRAKLLDSSSTTGAGLTGLTSASAGLIISTIADNEATATAYTVTGATIETITTLGTYAAPTATKCRFKELDATNHKGIYEFQFADARFAVANSKSMIVSVLGATNLQQADFLIQLQTLDPHATGVNVASIGGTTQTGGDIYPAIQAIGASTGSAQKTDAFVDNATVAIKGVSKVGTQTGTFASATAIDAIYHTITHAANAIDWIYGFNVGGGGTAVEYVFNGYLDSANDTITIQAYNFVGVSWETIGSLQGQGGTTNTGLTAALFPRHTGTSGADKGLTYIRVLCSGMTSPVLNIDQQYVNFAVTSRSVGYANGQVWVDTVDGQTGTELYVNGTADNPSLTWANAVTIATSLSLHNYHLNSGSSITLTASSIGYEIEGENWSLALGGQAIDGVYVHGAQVSGIGTTTAGNPAEFEHCHFQTCTLGPSRALACTLYGTFTIGTADGYLFSDCEPQYANSVPIIDFGAAVGATSIGFRRWAGEIQFNNMKTGDVAGFGGFGKIIIDASCTGGTISIRGLFELVGAAAFIAAGGTIVDTARWNEDQSIATVVDKAGYSLTQAFPSNFASMAITAGGIVDADIEAITGDTAAATKLERVLSGNTTGTVGVGSTTTSIVTSALNPAASGPDQFKGLVLKFDDATTTAALRGQGTDITGSTVLGVLTVTALTTAAVNGDIFTIS